MKRHHVGTDRDRTLLEQTTRTGGHLMVTVGA